MAEFPLQSLGLAMLGLESWLANFTQFVWEAQTEQSLADIPRPLVEYCIYGTFKTTQVAAAVGAFKDFTFTIGILYLP